MAESKVRGGAYLSADKKTWHDANGTVIPNPFGEPAADPETTPEPAPAPAVTAAPAAKAKAKDKDKDATPAANGTSESTTAGGAG